MKPATREPRAASWQTFGVRLDATGADVRIWAPEARRVALEKRDPVSLSGSPPENDTGSRFTLTAEAGGFFAGRIDGLAAGDRYSLVLDDEMVMPDPASRFQPDGVHGPSEVVDAASFAWRYRAPDVGLERASIYELHVGTFTTAGTFHAAAEKLPWLATLGVTIVELMPVAAFPGGRNWGYDGAALFAPSETYGTPDDLRRFVDAAHGLGLAVILDVVYNHFGPSGAYAAAASRRFFSDRHTSPWGRGINLDGPDAAAVRRFFIENALHWLVDYRMDGLRLDATHALVDDSATHFLAELNDVVRSTITHRQVLLIAEDHRNLRTLVAPRAAGGFGLDAVWADDFHHIVRRLVAGDDEAYFRDFGGGIDELVDALDHAWFYRGQASLHHDAPRGTDSTGLDRWQAVIALQNHDQVGNRALGDRLHHVVDAAVWRALSALLILAPETPLLFMGQEWAASTPFQYFTDHEPELGAQVRDGRRDEFKLFRAFSDPARRQAIPDPQAIETFLDSNLDWAETTEPAHAAVTALYRELLAIRRRLEPDGPVGTGGERIHASGPDALWMRRRIDDGPELLIVVRLRGHGPVTLPSDAAPTWTVVLDTESPAFAIDHTPPVLNLTNARVDFARPGAIVLGQPPANASSAQDDRA